MVGCSLAFVRALARVLAGFSDEALSCFGVISSYLVVSVEGSGMVAVLLALAVRDLGC